MSSELEIIRTYDNYHSYAQGYGAQCYYGMVVFAYRDEMMGIPDYDWIFSLRFLRKSSSGALKDEYRVKRDKYFYDEFQKFDDKFLRQFTGLPPDAPLPMKSNEIFDVEYWMHLVRWYYLPCNSSDSLLTLPQKFLERVKAGNFESYTDFLSG